MISRINNSQLGESLHLVFLIGKYLLISWGLISSVTFDSLNVILLCLCDNCTITSKWRNGGYRHDMLKFIQKLDYCIKATVVNALSDCDLIILCISVYVPNYKVYSDLDLLMAL